MSRKFMGILGTIFRAARDCPGRGSTCGNNMKRLDDATTASVFRRRSL
jgi:hypothetical protein